MLRIRLARVGKKKQPSYRVVVADIEAKRDGRIVERIGHYNPLSEPRTYEIDEGRALYWLSVGAQPTDSVRDLLRSQGTFGRLQRLRDGESLDDLVAEYEGTAVEQEAVEPGPVAEAEAVVSAAEATEEE
jgi:small subunit ribosomal protein S16